MSHVDNNEDVECLAQVAEPQEVL